MDTFVEIELEKAELQDLMQEIISVGKAKGTHPIKFLVALASSFKLIADHEGIEFKDIIAIIDDSNLDQSLH
jgi:hypothetical protein